MIEVDIVLPRKNFDLVIKEKFSEGITGIYGHSGSGKTSLLHSIAGLENPKMGNISIGGTKVFDAKEGIHIPVEKRNIGYVFQEGRLFPHMTVEKNLLYGQKKKAKSKVSFDEVVDLLNLGHILKSKPAQISGGERQRTALGRSLLSSPEILLLDEPFSAVDTNLRSQILPFILKIQQKIKIPILVVSHDIPDLLKLTNKLLLVKGGKCLGHGEYYDLLMQKETSSVFSSNSLINSINMEVEYVSPENGLTVLKWKKSETEVALKCEKSKVAYKTGDTIKLFVNADDIALATRRIENITIQNQVKGVVVDLIQRGSSLICLVNVGFRLVVEITADSQSRMDIQKGSEVWCLFKSVAIDVAG